MNKVVWMLRSSIVRMLTLATAMLVLPMIAYAQSGCTDSPENPTIVLVLVGSAGAFLSTFGRASIARRRSRR
jgi:XrtJ-associated TM-motif-TM protein